MSTNKHPKTGIAYGVIALERIDADIIEILLYGQQAVDIKYEAAKGAFIADARSQAQLDGIDFDEQRAIDAFNDEWIGEEPVIEGVYQNVKYQSSWMGGAPMLWIFESPKTGWYHPCSPCCPGAGDLHNWDRSLTGIKTYDTPGEWRA